MGITQALRTEIQKIIARGELKAAVHLLQDFLKNSPKLNEAILQSARLSDVSRQIRLGLIESTQANLTKDQIRMGILELLEEIETQSKEAPIRQEMERVVSVLHSKNVVSGSTISAGGDVYIGDKTVHTESPASRRLRLFVQIFFPILVIVLGLLWYRLQKMQEMLMLTVALDNRTPNPELPFQGGSVILQYGNKSDTLPIQQEVDFKGIPASFSDETLALRFVAAGFINLDTTFVLSGERLTLPIRRDDTFARIFGTIKDQEGNPVSGAQVSVLDIHVQSDISGNFLLPIPFEKQRPEQRIRVYKSGYRDWDNTSPVIKNETIGIILSSE